MANRQLFLLNCLFKINYIRQLTPASDQYRVKPQGKENPDIFDASSQLTNFSESSKWFEMASLIVRSSVARCAAATVSRTATRALSTTAAALKESGGQLNGLKLYIK